MRIVLGLVAVLAIALIALVTARLESGGPRAVDGAAQRPAATGATERAPLRSGRGVAESPLQVVPTTGSSAPDPGAGAPTSERAALEDEFRALERELSLERRRLFEERFERGEYRVMTDTGAPITPVRGHDGVEVEVSWRRVQENGQPVVQVATLPLPEYPDYYRKVVERNELRRRLDGLPPE